METRTQVGEAESGVYTLPETSTTLYSPEGVKVVILGTTHISIASVLEAQQIVQHERPRVVIVELCKSRRHMLNLPLDGAIQRVDFNMTEVQNVLSNGQGLVGVVHLVLSHFTWQMAEKIGLEISPGTEFAAAYQEVKKYGGKVFLGDRNLEVTLVRAWRALSILEKLSMLWLMFNPFSTDLDSVSADDLERLKESDMITEVMLELGEHFPRLLEPLVYERDRFMRYKIRDCCKQMAKYLNSPTTPAQEKENGGNTVVCIVGMGHVKGIVDNWLDPIDYEDMDRISHKPPAPFLGRMLFYSTMLTCIGGISFIVYRKLKN